MCAVDVGETLTYQTLSGNSALSRRSQDGGDSDTGDRLEEKDDFDDIHRHMC